MKDFQFSLPQNIIVGRGSSNRLHEAAEKIGGTHGLLISGPVLKRMGVADKITDSLKKAGIPVDEFTDVEANPSVDTVEKAVERYKKCGADFIIALGGGSPMDVAKAVAIVALYGGSITDYEGAHKVPGPVIPMIAIPTTAGTGSKLRHLQ